MVNCCLRVHFNWYKNQDSADYILPVVLWDLGIYSENSEIIIRLHSFSKQIWNILVSYISLWNDCHVKIFKHTVFSSGSFCQIYRVTDETLIAETTVWPNFFLMNVFFALKGSKLFILFISATKFRIDTLWRSKLRYQIRSHRRRWHLVFSAFDLVLEIYTA